VSNGLRLVIGWPAQGLFIQIVLQDRFNAAVAFSADGKGSFACLLQPVVAVAFGEPQDAQAASKGLLRIGPASKDTFDQRLGITGPILAAQLMKRSGVHSSHLRWDSGICSFTVVWWPGTRLRTWLATRLLL
jgi:hypothetical protein